MADPMVFDSRMGASDAIMWNIERDPMLRSTITSVLLLDRAPEADRLSGAVVRSLERIPRLRQRVVLDPLGAAPPRWERDPQFDLGYHYRRLSAPGGGSLRALLDMAAPIAMQAFDKDRPLWELYQVDGLEEGRTALLMKLHHSVSDGVGMVRMTSSLVERSREAEASREGAAVPSVLEAPGPSSAFEEALGALRHRAEADLRLTTRAGRALREGAASALRDPLGTLRGSGELLGSLAKSLRPVSEPLSPLMRGRSLAVRFDVIGLPLEDLKRAAKNASGTLNDAFVGAVAGGLRRYHAHHGHAVDALRMTMPINLREGEDGRKAGNRFAPARFEVPIGIADPAARMRAIHDCVVAERSERALPLAEDIAVVLGRLPRVASLRLLGSMLKAIDFVTSNVPGPPFPVFASGAHVERMFGFGPLSGAAASIVLFSYDGQIQIGINTDRAAVPDPELFVQCLGEGIDEVMSLA
jgi:diacylglycerol O-acyltransferase